MGSGSEKDVGADGPVHVHGPEGPGVGAEGPGAGAGFGAGFDAGMGMGGFAAGAGFGGPAFGGPPFGFGGPGVGGMGGGGGYWSRVPEDDKWASLKSKLFNAYAIAHSTARKVLDAFGPSVPKPPGAMTVVKRDTTKSRMLVMGIRSETKIEPGKSLKFEASPQDTIAALAVFIRDAECWNVIDIQVGSVSQFGNAVPIPAEGLIGLELRFDTAQIAQPVRFHVENRSDEPRYCEALIYGVVIRI